MLSGAGQGHGRGTSGLSARSARTRRWVSAMLTAALMGGVVGVVAPGAGAAAIPSDTAAAGVSTTVAQPSGPLNRASAQAASSGQPVDIPELTSATSTTAANPDGTFTLTQAADPVRAKLDGTWKALDPSLTPRPDGSFQTAVTTEPVVLSGGFIPKARSLR